MRLALVGLILVLAAPAGAGRDKVRERTVKLGAGEARAQLRIAEPRGVVLLLELTVPHGARVSATGRIPIAGVSISTGRHDICHRSGEAEVCVQPEEWCPLPAAVWRFRIHKEGGPAGAVTLRFGVGAPSAQPRTTAAVRGGRPIALVTAETENELLAVDLDSGKIVRRLQLPAQPENVDVRPVGTFVAVSTRAGAVTLIDSQTLKIVKVLRGFKAPHIAAISPDGKWAYVSDDALGTLSVIELARARIVARLAVGPGAHHLTVSPDGERLWVALGETAQTIVAVDVSKPAHPRVVARFAPGFVAHDLSFSSDGRRVWITADNRRVVGVVSASTHRLLFEVPAGPGPQHLAFNNRSAYITSGYGSEIEQVSPQTGHVLRVVRVPYGSFNLATAGGLVVVSSLLRGTVTELTDELRVIRTLHVAPAARDVGITVW
jgi:DNA-binding beta-propeller fold protein YncE